jgi:hypothetical protein
MKDAAKSVILGITVVILAIVVFITWTSLNDGHFGWPHIVGLGASILLLILTWFWPGTRQPTQPPP